MSKTLGAGTDLERIRDALHRAVRKFCPRWLAADREDLVQAATLRVLQLSRKGKEPDSLEASYLWRVAHSAVLDEIRRRRRQDLLPEEAGATIPDSRGDPESSLHAERVRQGIQEGLQRLTPPRRLAVLLYLHGFSLADSARILGWTAKRVDNQRYQGLAELRRYLEKRGIEA